MMASRWIAGVGAVLFCSISFLMWIGTGEVTLDLVFFVIVGIVCLFFSFPSSGASRAGSNSLQQTQNWDFLKVVGDLVQNIRSRETLPEQCQFKDAQGGRCEGRVRYFISCIVKARGYAGDLLAGGSLHVCDDHHPEIGKDGEAVREHLAGRNLKIHFIGSTRGPFDW